ncbi:MAG: methylmalonyl-CoA epimerase [Euryarchaeota archaeon]|jgi:methylmalonyl-CoA/ethylmalonyl-CoA epimerase|nr:methylmalonyl-CoA epimerase [Euryarchaeota archaeon]
MTDIGRVFIDHIGIAASSLEEGSKFWKLLGLVQAEHDEVNEEQGVVTRFFEVPASESRPPMLEILEPTGENTPIGKFLSKRGPGIQQLCLRVEDIEQVIEHLLENGIKMIDESPRQGVGGAIIAFVHPKSTGGVLVELSQH